jgi:hypothetical protein
MDRFNPSVNTSREEAGSSFFFFSLSSFLSVVLIERNLSSHRLLVGLLRCARKSVRPRRFFVR